MFESLVTMSFVDLATLAMHRRQDMEARIQMFHEKCDRAIHEINKLKFQGQRLVEQLNCEASELKERFLNSMKQLDEYIYLMTDINLILEKIDNTNINNSTPVLDTTNTVVQASTILSNNLLDTLSEPTPSTSGACANQCPITQPKKKKIPKVDQPLIDFSSTSTSNDSIPINDDIQSSVTDGLKNLKLEDSMIKHIKNCNLPAQTVLQVDKKYPAVIVHVEELCFWVTTDNIVEAFELTAAMTKYYGEHRVELNLEQVMSLTYCAVYDDEICYRGFFIHLSNADMSMAEVYALDTGETTYVPTCTLQPLKPAFCIHPPFARCCHFAGIELPADKDKMKQLETFTQIYKAWNCTIVVDDNTSESLGVYAVLETGKTLNELIVDAGIAEKADRSLTNGQFVSTNGCELTEKNLDITLCPEYDDPIVAVTGYHNRDEVDICKHYKGGPEKTCFKGARCTKKHIVKHPDGWTSERVPVIAGFRTLPLPAPGTWLRVLVTHVAHYDRFFVQTVTDYEPEQLSSFGVVLPPSNLTSLVQDMNSPATVTAYRPLVTVPAPGELVAARYPFDGCWYRARVVSATRIDQNVEVFYIDYGDKVSVKESEVRQLDARFCALPAQAVLCALAGVGVRNSTPATIGNARKALTKLIQNVVFEAHVIATGYDEITVELYNEKGVSVAVQLAATKLVELKGYSVEHNKDVQQKVCLP